MRILNVIQCTNLGGMERASLELMLAMKVGGHHVEYISLAPLGELEAELKRENINVVSVMYGAENLWSVFWGIRKKVREARPDALIMTGHNFLANLALIGLKMPSRILSVHFHHEGVMPSWKWRLIYAFACIYFQYITFPSDFVRVEAETILPWIKKKSKTVRNPLKTLGALPDKKTSRNHFGVDENVTVIGNAGWLIPRKRFDVFLKTAAEFIKLNGKTIFLIAGDGELNRELKALSKELGIEANVKWVGWLKTMDQFYASLDVLLFTSDWDALGMTAIEAMAHGIPVVASVKNGGLSELLNSTNGWFHDDHDVESIVSSLASAITNEGRQKAAIAKTEIVELTDASKLKDEFEMLLSRAH